MLFKTFSLLTKLSLSLVIMLLLQVHACEEKKPDGLDHEEQQSYHSSENLIGIPSSRGGELRRLLLENDLSVAIDE